MEAIIAGPAKSPYEGGTFRLRIQVPPDYPFRRRGWGLMNWKLGMSATRCGRMRRPKCVEIAICSVTAAQTQEKGIIVATLWNVEGIETCVLVKFPRYKRQESCPIICPFNELKLKPTKQQWWCMMVHTVHCPLFHLYHLTADRTWFLRIDLFPFRKLCEPSRPPRVKFLTQIWIPSVHPQHGCSAAPWWHSSLDRLDRLDRGW